MCVMYVCCVCICGMNICRLYILCMYSGYVCVFFNVCMSACINVWNVCPGVFAWTYVSTLHYVLYAIYEDCVCYVCHVWYVCM